MRATFYVLLVGVLSCVGCAMLHSAPPLPVRYSVPRGPQLVVNSDFKLPDDSRLLAELEQLRDRISRALELPVSEQPIQVYLFKDDVAYRRFLKQHFPDFPNRRAFFVRRKGELAVYAHYSDRVAEDLRHEVSHGYMHSVLDRVPLWLDEGLAEYFEMSPEARGIHAQHIEELAGALAPSGAPNSWTPDLSRLESLAGAASLQQVDYAESWAWVHWLLETTPQRREALQDYLRTIRKGGNPPQLSEWLFEHDIDFDRARLIEHLHTLSNRAGNQPLVQ
jgi:hypothetical protein